MKTEIRKTIFTAIFVLGVMFSLGMVQTHNPAAGSVLFLGLMSLMVFWAVR